jgi:hypothetical protein
MPTIAYPGGKARLAGKLTSFLPTRGRVYIEPFAGRGNLFWAAAERGLKFRRWWLNDIATAPFFAAIQELGNSIKVPPRSRDVYERYREANRLARDWNALVPYLLEMHRRLSAPGRRTDLRKGAPAGLTWTAWVESKRAKLGRSLRSVQRLLRGKTEASRNWKSRPHATLSSGSDSAEMLKNPMGLAFEMANLVLTMRRRNHNTTANRRRLERLASRFLATAERRSLPRKESGSIANDALARAKSASTLMM